MTTDYPAIQKIHMAFSRHERRYCCFSVAGRDGDFLYYSHMTRPLRSLMFGRDFLGRLPGLMDNENLCVECGLGLSVEGGVALDDGDLIAWHFTVRDANRVLESLRQQMGSEGSWIELF